MRALMFAVVAAVLFYLLGPATTSVWAVEFDLNLVVGADSAGQLELFFSQLGSDLGYESWAMRLLCTF